MNGQLVLFQPKGRSDPYVLIEYQKFSSADTEFKFYHVKDKHLSSDSFSYEQIEAMFDKGYWIYIVNLADVIAEALADVQEDNYE